MNKFVNSIGKKDTTTENGAVSNSSTGNPLLDYFAKCGSYRNRTQESVNADMASIFGYDPLSALKIVFYNRMVTRKVNDVPQKGQGNKDEFIRSLIWINNAKKELLNNNLWLIPLVGCWKDLWYDSPVTSLYFYADAKEVAKLIKQAIKNEDTDLLRKFLPKVRSKSNTKNARHARLNSYIKELCHALSWNVSDYRKFKSKGNAVKFQNDMCTGNWKGFGKQIKTIPGRALFKMVNGKGKDKKNLFERHNLEKKLNEFVLKNEVKFTGYPYELMKKVKSANTLNRMVLDKQFESLLKKAKDGTDNGLLNKNVLCALDTSGSMQSSIGDGSTTAYDVCISLGVFFSSLMTGHFKDHVIMFDAKSRFLRISGGFCDKVQTITGQIIAWGNTNFQSVIDEIVRIRNSDPSIPIEDFPSVLLVVSDMQFDHTRSPNTNYEAAMKKLANVGLPKMTIIWWNVNGRGKDVPSTLDDEGTVLISGFDGSIVSAILGAEEIKENGVVRKANPLEVMNKCLDQEILRKVSNDKVKSTRSNRVRKKVKNSTSNK